MKPGLILAIDKPLQWTSFQVVNKLKWHLKREFGLRKFKIGHAGTLDPLATGLLLVCVGSATKQIESLQAGRKVYTGTLVLGATTPCFDLERAVDHYYPTDHLTPEAIAATCAQFTGRIAQVPPTFSAVKVDGQRAYAAAREGSDIEIAAKEVEIYSLEISDIRMGDSNFQPPAPLTTPLDDRQRELYREPQGVVPEGLPQVDFRVECSKGTYIRSLARDIGQALQSGAFLSALRRERIGDYTLADALTVDQIESQIRLGNPQYEMLKALGNPS